jgi:SsrA-binding protein
MQIVVNNKKAYHDYEILEKYEAGLSLKGNEVKSIRNGKVSLKESYVRIKNNQAFIINMHIAHLDTTNRAYAPDEKRDKRLLLHKKEIRKLEEKIKQGGLSVVPLKLYFNNRNLAKLEIALARGLKKYDKREAIKKREVDRKIKQAIKEYY